MSRVRSHETAVQFDRAAIDPAGAAGEERLPVATAGLLILALSLFGWLVILGFARLVIG